MHAIYMCIRAGDCGAISLASAAELSTLRGDSLAGGTRELGPRGGGDRRPYYGSRSGVRSRPAPRLVVHACLAADAFVTNRHAACSRPSPSAAQPSGTGSSEVHMWSVVSRGWIPAQFQSTRIFVVLTCAHARHPRRLLGHRRGSHGARAALRVCAPHRPILARREHPVVSKTALSSSR